MQHLLGMTLDELKSVVINMGAPAFVAKQMSEWLYKKRVTDVGQMTNISLANRQKIAGTYDVGAVKPSDVKTSADGTKKYLFPVGKGKYIESVYIPDKDRATLCVSTQVGCKMNCLFCNTGKQGFAGQLSVTEILNQIQSIPESAKLTNVVFMGMGEPFDNVSNVLRALEILTAQYGYAWSPKRITVSSVGVMPGLKRFLEESTCHLAISLHNPFHDERLKIMPIEKAYPVADVVELIKKYDFTGQRRISFEYILFKGFNDTPAHAAEIKRLTAGLPCLVNLIRFHRVDGVPLDGLSDGGMLAFENALRRRGINTTIRHSRGEDIWAACGLLSTMKKNGEIEEK